MNLYHISQDEANDYDTYDAAIVAAETEDEARSIHPNGLMNPRDGRSWEEMNWVGDWCQSPDSVKVKYLGPASLGIQAGVILASFNAG